MPKRFSNPNPNRGGRGANQRPAAPGNRKPQQHGQAPKTIGGLDPNRHVQPLLLGLGSNRDYQPDRKRPSVFDRLGTKRFSENNNQGLGGSSFDREREPGPGMAKGTQFRNTAGGHSSGSRNDSRPSSSAGRRDRDEYEKDLSGQRRPRSRTPSPRYNRNQMPSATPLKDESRSSVQRHSRIDKPSEKSLAESRGSKSNDQKFHGDKTKLKDSSRSQKPGQKSSDKSKKRPSNSSPGTSSRSSSTSQSSSSSGSSSSSSTSESSAPSIKLKPEKKTKSSINKSKSSQLKEPGSSKSRGQAVESSPDGSRPSPSPRGHRKDNDFSSNQRQLKSDQPPADRLMEGYRRSRDRDRPSSGAEHRRSNSRMRLDEPGRKRRLSGESYGSAGKRSRRESPSPSMKYKSAPNKNTSSPHRNESPFVRDRNRPPSRERIRLVPSESPKHPPYDDMSSRNDPRGRDSSMRYDSPRSKDLNRERPFSAASYGTTGSNSPSFSRDRDEKRPRERLAPARTPTPLMRDQNRERDRPPPLHDFEPVRRAPLLPYPLLPDHGHGRNQQQRRRPPPEDLRRNAPPSSIPSRPRSPMIVKTKEALIEKYEDQSKKSRVDLWVDETVRGTRQPLLSDIGITPRDRGSIDEPIRNRPDTTPTTSDRPKSDESVPISLGNPTSTETAKVDTPIEPLEEVLSEISDDDDDILTKPVEKVDSPEPEPEVSTTKTDDKLSEKDSDVANAKVTSSDNTIGEDAPDSKSVKSEVTLMPPPTETTATRDREIQSQSHTQSHSHTDDDILEQMDFEEISDEELDNHPETNKIGIVDALGVDWSSLVCREKVHQSSEVDDASTSFERARVKERWTPANIFKQIGLSRSLVSEKLFQKIMGKVGEMETRCGIVEKTTEEELETPLLRRRRIERKNCLEKYGLGPASRALSARRDLSLRRYLLDLPPKPLISLELSQSS